MQDGTADHPYRTITPLNRGKLIGSKPPFESQRDLVHSG